MTHVYGPHIFHTYRQDVWDYVNRFATFYPYINRVKAHTPRGVFSIPLNLLTINQFFGKQFSPNEAQSFLASLSIKNTSSSSNFEQAALEQIGEDLYRNFFYGYSLKQWGCPPARLPVSVFKRLPLRFNYDDRHYQDPFQGIPLNGYTELVQNILTHTNIEVRLNQSINIQGLDEFSHTFFTGTVDSFFNHKLGRLSYRTVYFERIESEGDFQGNAVINDTREEIPYTRTHEHKHFAPWEEHKKTVAFREFSKATQADDTPYYPMRLPEDLDMLNQYQLLASQTAKVSFLGRLGTYRYLDMDKVIGEALDFSKHIGMALSDGTPIPSFLEN
jgi:UDP-galactopyranose mutase